MSPLERLGVKAVALTAILTLVFLLFPHLKPKEPDPLPRPVPPLQPDPLPRPVPPPQPDPLPRPVPPPQPDPPPRLVPPPQPTATIRGLWIDSLGTIYQIQGSDNSFQFGATNNRS